MPQVIIEFNAVAEAIHLQARPGIEEGWYVLMRTVFGQTKLTTLYGPMKDENEAEHLAPDLAQEELARMQKIIQDFWEGWNR